MPITKDNIVHLSLISTRLTNELMEEIDNPDDSLTVLAAMAHMINNSCERPFSKEELIAGIGERIKAISVDMVTGQH